MLELTIDNQTIKLNKPEELPTLLGNSRETRPPNSPAFH